MKKILFLSFSLLMIYSLSSFAEKIMIAGKPVFLQKQGDVYYVPDTYKAKDSYYYVYVNGTKQVCYLDIQPNLSALNMTILSVNFQGSLMHWNCYPLDINYFQTQ